MVRAGLPISQRNESGIAKSTWPVAVRGCVNVWRERVWTKSADQDRKFFCAANQPSRTALVSGANRFCPVNNNASAKNIWRRRVIFSAAARLGQNETIARHTAGWPARTHAGFPA